VELGILPSVDKILKQGCQIISSGTTGPPKKVFRTPENIRSCNEIAIESQKLTKQSRVYTVCKMEHAAGLLAQTVPALSIGADVHIEEFNAYTFIRNIRNFTHTHVTPVHCEILSRTKGFYKLDLAGLWVTCGSSPINWDHIEMFVSKGAIFMANWGMSEIGPCAINMTFRDLDRVKEHRKIGNKKSILGDTFYVNYKIIRNELYVKGDICIYDKWFGTGDLVEEEFYEYRSNNKSILYFIGRK